MATILIVEDDTLTADCYHTWLSVSPHKIQHVANVMAAVEAVDKTPPDVILLDMLLPGATGVQLLHVLQSHADLQNIPVIICSNTQPELTADLQAYGVCAVLNKAALTRQELIKTVESVL
jgi:twitching motility two-component system response regulator PilH